MNTGFSSVHPGVCFTYYTVIFAFAMTLYHPVYLASMLISLIIWLLMHEKGRSLSGSWQYYLLTGIAVLIINPLINHRGERILFFLGNKAVTFEAVVYGFTMMLSLLTILMAFICFRQAVDNHKFLYLFSSILPKTAFLIMMSMGFVPLLAARMKQISIVQKTRGIDMTEGTVVKRAKDGMKILKILISCSLEGALQTADSMKGRGYGIAKRSSYMQYRINCRDWLIMTSVTILSTITAAGLCFGYGKLVIFPSLESISMDLTGIILYSAFCLLLIIPIIVEGREILIWHCCK
jgi:energy-coupling factor transport system permease protein